VRANYLTLVLGGVVIGGSILCAQTSGRPLPEPLPRLLVGTTSAALTLAAVWVVGTFRDGDTDDPDHLADIDALARQDQLATRGLLSASVGHEIRNVISVVKMRLYLACQQTDGDVAEELESIADSIGRLEDLSNRLSPYPDDTPTRDDQFRLREAVAAAVDVVAPKTDDEIAIEVEIASNPDICACNSAFTQVLVNLLLNACDAVRQRDNGRVHVRAGRRGAEAVITVADNGPGIPTDHLDRVFEPFFTTKDADADGGTGIGLWLCRQLVDQCDGTIRAENTDSAGAKFTVELPAPRSETCIDRTPDGARQFPQQNPPDDSSEPERTTNTEHPRSAHDTISTPLSTADTFDMVDD